MKFLTKLLVSSVLCISSMSAYAYDCVLGGVGHCIWAFDKDDLKGPDLIDQALLVDFCDKNNIYCSAFTNGYNGIVGRFLDGEIFLITGKGWGGPDLILENKEQAVQFVDGFKKIARHPDARFHVEKTPNKLDPQGRRVAVAYKNGEEIKLMLLPNRWEESGDEYVYIPEDV
jgi:hypothetical protein